MAIEYFRRIEIFIKIAFNLCISQSDLFQKLYSTNADYIHFYKYLFSTLRANNFSNSSAFKELAFVMFSIHS